MSASPAPAVKSGHDGPPPRVLFDCDLWEIAMLKRLRQLAHEGVVDEVTISLSQRRIISKVDRRPEQLDKSRVQ